MRRNPHRVLRPVTALGGILFTGLAFGQSLDGIISAERERIAQAQEAQDQIDSVAETTRARFDEYQRLLKDIDGLVVYNDLMQAQIDDQERQLADLRESIDTVTVVERQVLPLMTRMIDGLERFIELDVPFLLEERMARVENLRNLLTRSDVTTAEQFRNVMQAWQVENDYGYFPEAYPGTLRLGGANREVDFLKLGRVALYYITPDDSAVGVWDQRIRDWVSLESSDAVWVRNAINLIESGTPPTNLFLLPVAPPQEN